MEEPSIDSTQKPPHWFLRSCRRLRGKRTFFWGIIILGLGLNVIGALLFTAPSLKQFSVGWPFTLIILLIGIYLLILSLVVDLGSRLYGDISTEDFKKRYFEYIIQETETFELKGLPAGLIFQNVQLDEIFISLQFLPNLTSSGYSPKEKELQSLRDRLDSGVFLEEIERVRIEAEKNWQQDVTKKSNSISITYLWQWLDKEHPVAIIQGSPGMGKSTFLARLALYMARRNLNQSDPMGPHLKPSLIPIALRLGEYATERDRVPDLSLEAYLKLVLGRLDIPGLVLLIEKYLESGCCLILLDGLDEISDQQMRKEIQEAIKTFILEQSNSSGEASYFNRFLITSRPAGYDLAAFPDYQHYTIAKLTSEQIEQFLHRWCSANVRREQSSRGDGHQDEQDKAIAKEAIRLTRRLIASVKQHRGLRELAENPLLLTLLALMQQSSIALPRQRVELYTVVIRTLLENRNITKNIPPIPEAQAIRRLGPLAFEMQGKGNSLASQSEVLTSLARAISLEEGTNNEVEYEAKTFLERVSKRGGLFIEDANGYFGFFHRTFQEYFTARHMLNQIKYDPAYGNADLVNRAQRRDDLWREPFLFAVAYKSGEDSKMASQIIRNLLATSQDARLGSREHDLLLAAECLIEAKPLTIDPVLEKRIAEQLLRTYEEAQQRQQYGVCGQIETVMRRWLLSLPKEAYHPPLLDVLQEAISDTSYDGHQRSAIALLAAMLDIDI